MHRLDKDWLEKSSRQMPPGVTRWGRIFSPIVKMFLPLINIPSTRVDPHFLYHLGPPIQPTHVVKTGNIYRNGRVWCAIDTLLTSSTIAEARDLTQKRAQSG